MSAGTAEEGRVFPSGSRGDFRDLLRLSFLSFLLGELRLQGLPQVLKHWRLPPPMVITGPNHDTHLYRRITNKQKRPIWVLGTLFGIWAPHKLTNKQANKQNLGYHVFFAVH